MKKIKLFYIPYAGGSALSCKSWKRFLDPECFEIHPLEPAGRGSRFGEGFYQDMEEATTDLLKMLQSHLDKEDSGESDSGHQGSREFDSSHAYAIYGHSFGAVLTYELYYRIMDAGMELPKHLFLSGSKPPFHHSRQIGTYALPDTEFIQELLYFGGMEPEILRNKELLDLFLPVIRADFKVLDHYCYREKESLIQVPVSVLYGNDMDFESVSGWKMLAGDQVDFTYIDGSHFFIREKPKEVLSIVTDRLYQYRQPTVSAHIDNDRMTEAMRN